MEEEVKGVHYIPKTALIPIEVGSGYLQRLQKLLIYMLDDKTPEEIENLKQNLINNKVAEDSWEYQYQTVQTLIITIEQTAIEKGITTFKTED